MPHRRLVDSIFESGDQQIGFEEEAYSFAACKEEARAFTP
jgi:hypothetical protein